MTALAPFIAREFHDAYERLAPQFGWNTQQVSKTVWEALPENQRRLMVATVAELLERGVVR